MRRPLFVALLALAFAACRTQPDAPLPAPIVETPPPPTSTRGEFLIEAGKLKASGPFVGAERDSALLIFSADSADQVRALVADVIPCQG